MFHNAFVFKVDGVGEAGGVHRLQEDVVCIIVFAGNANVATV